MMMLNGSSHATTTTGQPITEKQPFHRNEHTPGQPITHIRLTVMLKVATSSLAQGYPVS